MQINYIIIRLAFLLSRLLKVIYVLLRKTRDEFIFPILELAIENLQLRRRIRIRKRYKKSKKTSRSQKIYLAVSKYKYIDLFLLSIRVFFETDKIITQYKIAAFREHCIKHNLNYVVTENEVEREVCKAAFWKRSEKECRKYWSPQSYIAEIKDAEVIGESQVIVANHFFLNDMLYYDDEKRVDIRYSSIRKIINQYVIIEKEKGKSKQIAEAIDLVSVATHNYFHTMIEVLPRLLIIDEYKEYRNLPVLVDEIILTTPQMNAALTAVNRYNHTIISVKKGESWKVQRLIYVSGSTWMPINVYHRDQFRMSDFMISEKYLMSLRNRVLESVALDKNRFSSQIFISRKNAHTVRLKNETVIRNKFEDSGFQIIFTEEMTFEEQVNCFYHAQCVVSATGAALTNILFCRPHTEIVCIMPKEFQFEMYSTMAHLLQLDPVFLDAEIVEKTAYISADTYAIDEDYVKEFIAEYLKGSYYENKRIEGM